MRSLVFLTLVLATACSRAEAAPASRSIVPESGAGAPVRVGAPPADPAPPALEGPSFVRLDLPDRHVAYVGVPVGARTPRPILVGVHGAGDRADWSCSEWQAVTAGWAFVVCPEGVPHGKYPGTFVWGSAEAIAKTADLAVAELRTRYGAWTEHDQPLVYGGWSQGATLAASVVAARPHLYDRVALVEVGHTPVDAAVVVDTLARSGVRRAVVSCSSGPCRVFSQKFERAAARRGLRSGFVDVGLRGHWFDEPVFRALGPKVAWMVDDEPRFLGLAAAVDARFQTD